MSGTNGTCDARILGLAPGVEGDYCEVGGGLQAVGEFSRRTFGVLSGCSGFEASRGVALVVSSMEIKGQVNLSSAAQIGFQVVMDHGLPGDASIGRAGFPFLKKIDESIDLTGGVVEMAGNSHMPALMPFNNWNFQLMFCCQPFL